MIMAISIGRYRFEGPFTATAQLRRQSGVYVIHCVTGGRYHNIDVGESQDVRKRVDSHDRAPCWTRNCRGTLTVSVLYCGEADRMRVEKELRTAQVWSCGQQ